MTSSSKTFRQSATADTGKCENGDESTEAI